MGRNVDRNGDAGLVMVVAPAVDHAAVDDEIAGTEIGLAVLQHQRHPARQNDQIVDRVGGVHPGRRMGCEFADGEARAGRVQHLDLVGLGGVGIARIVGGLGFGLPDQSGTEFIRVRDRPVDDDAAFPVIVEAGDNPAMCKPRHFSCSPVVFLSSPQPARLARECEARESGRFPVCWRLPGRRGRARRTRG